MSIITNADSKVTDQMRAKDDQHGRRMDYIDEKVKQAQLHERGEGDGAPAPSLVRFAWQREAFTEDTKYDASRDAVAGRTNLSVKDYVVLANGDMEHNYGDAHLDFIREGRACWKCGDVQGDTPELRDAAWKKRELHLGPAPEGCSSGRNCTTCLAELAPRGDTRAGIETNNNTLTPEQLKLMMMTGVMPEGM